MNLESLNFAELTDQELSTIDGGYSWGEFFADAGYVAGYTTGIVIGSVLVATEKVLETVIR